VAQLYTARRPLVLATVDGFVLGSTSLTTLLQVGPVTGHLFEVAPTLEVVSGATTVTLLVTWTSPRGPAVQYNWYTGQVVSGIAGQLPWNMEASVGSGQPITLQAQAATAGQVYVGGSISRKR